MHSWIIKYKISLAPLALAGYELYFRQMSCAIIIIWTTYVAFKGALVIESVKIGRNPKETVNIEPFVLHKRELDFFQIFTDTPYVHFNRLNQRNKVLQELYIGWY